MPDKQNKHSEEAPPIKEDNLTSELENGKKEVVSAIPPEIKDLRGEKESDQEINEKLEKLRKEIHKSEREATKKEGSDIVKALRLAHRFPSEAVPISLDEEQLIREVAVDTAKRLNNNYQPGFGVFPTADSKEIFYGQVWARDFAQAAGNYFAFRKPEALIDSFNVIFKYQRSDGMLPFRVEREYMLVRAVPGLYRLAKPLCDLIEKRIKKRNERPVYEGQDFSNNEDTVPVLLVALGEFYINSEEGKNFAREHIDQIEKAIDFFRSKTDPEDGLVVARYGNADWADSIKRGGKLGGINVWWARSLRSMEFMMSSLGYAEKAEKYREEFRKVKTNLIDKLYNKEEGYFRAAENEDRVDAVASIFGALYFLSPSEAVRVEQTLKARMQRRSGLKNFDPPYPANQIYFFPQRLFGMKGYHNEYTWPWVTCQNIQVKVKIALQHQEESVRNQYQKEAVADFLDMASLFKEAGGAYEICDPDTRKPPKMLFYKPPRNLMGSLAAFQGAYIQLKELGWLKKEK